MYSLALLYYAQHCAQQNMAAPLLARFRLAAVLGTRAYLAGFSAGLGRFKTRFAGEALGNLASPGSAMFEMFGAIQRLYSFIGSIVMPASCRTFCKFISLKNNVLAYCIPYLQ